MDNDIRICVFCETQTYAYICPVCREYEGLVTLEEAKAYL